MANINKIKILNSSSSYDEYDIIPNKIGTDSVGDEKSPIYLNEGTPTEINIFDLIYPVGLIYMSVNNVSPQSFIGGTWEQIKDTFLLSAGDTWTAGSTGGSKDLVIPYHNHTFTGSAVTSKGPSTASTGGPSNNTSGTPSNNTTNSTGSHVHYYDAYACNHEAQGYGLTGSQAFINRVAVVQSNGSTTASGGDHYHTLNNHTHSLQSHTHSLQSHTHSMQSHTHSVTAAGTIGYAGSSGNTTNANMPPYLVVYMWKRTK